MAYIRFTNDGWYSRKPLEQVLEGCVCIADACAQIWNHDHAGSTVYVGLDTRAGSKPIADSVAGTLAGAGFRVVMPERPCPMPAIDHAIANDPDAAGGLIVGADHRSADVPTAPESLRGHAPVRSWWASAHPSIRFTV